MSNNNTMETYVDIEAEEPLHLMLDYYTSVTYSFNEHDADGNDIVETVTTQPRMLVSESTEEDGTGKKLLHEFQGEQALMIYDILTAKRNK